ncbi:MULTISPECIES: hypothetical protein [unclassified Mycobacterium]|nr:MULTISPECIES: hypothetical protein [unclassified Mycobacterium]
MIESAATPDSTPAGSAIAISWFAARAGGRRREVSSAPERIG